MVKKHPQFRSAKGISCFTRRAKVCEWCSFGKETMMDDRKRNSKNANAVPFWKRNGKNKKTIKTL